MRIFSYRNKVRLRRAGIIVLIAAVVLAVACAAYIIYLGRYMVYTADGAHLSMPGSEADSGQTAPSDTPRPTGEYIVGEQTERPQTAVPSPGQDAPDEADAPTVLGDGCWMRAMSRTRPPSCSSTSRANSAITTILPP